ncbi:MFS transporter [Pseudarthrobacter sp. P1]|uniref:MFS transporter n=1 Tax=Pseudarthrobacter sp. P1 TaxID=3418418 RepID=UPI003CF1478F
MRKPAWLVAAGIILVALTLRSAVTVVPPLVSTMDAQLPMDAATIGLLGMLPTAAFAVFGFLTPYVIRWASLEWLAVVAMVLATVGQLLRVMVPSTGLFLLLSVLALAGLGAGNVLLPPLVKKYFPTKVGLMTAIYVTSLSVGTALPAQLAVPVADAAGWQVSLAAWAGVTVVAMVPWLGVLATGRGSSAPAGGPAPTAPTAAQTPAEQALAVVVHGARTTPAAPGKMNLWRSPVAWGLTFMFGCTSLNTYAMFAWLPTILTEAGLDRASAGSMLALFAALGLPMSLLVPLLAARMANPFPMVLVMLGCFVAGYLGLLFAPATATWLWVVLTGLGPGTFPLSLLMINHRTRTHTGAGALSGFSQGMGYALACAGPLLFGLLHQASGSWGVPFLFLFGTLALLCAGAFVICRPRMLEDDFAPAAR